MNSCGVPAWLEDYWRDNLVCATVVASIEGLALAELTPSSSNRKRFLFNLELKGDVIRTEFHRTDST